MFGWLSHFKFSLSHIRDKTKNVFLLFLYQAQNLSSLIFLFRFLGEVEIFSKPLQKGLKVVHTLSELLTYTSSIIQWHVCDCLILTKGICGNKVFYGLIFLLPYWKLLKLINLVLRHLTWLTFFSWGISTPTTADTLCMFYVILFMTYNATDFVRYQITLAEYKFMFSLV